MRSFDCVYFASEVEKLMKAHNSLVFRCLWDELAGKNEAWRQQDENQI